MAKKALKKTAKKTAKKAAKPAKPAVKKAVKKTVKKAAKKVAKKAAKKPKPVPPAPLATTAATGADESPDPHGMLPLHATLDALRDQLAPIDPNNTAIQGIIEAIDTLKGRLHCQGGQTFPPAP